MNPNNLCVYIAAVAGYNAGLIAGRNQPTDPTENDYNDGAERADAFGQAVDTVWGVASYTNADLQQIENGATAMLASGRSIVPGPVGLTAAGYTGIATALIAGVQAGTRQIVAEGVNPNGCAGGGGSSFATRQTAFANQSFNVPVAGGLAGSPTATLIHNSTLVVFSAPVSVVAGGLLFFGGGAQPYIIAADVTAGTNVQLVQAFQGTGNSGVAVTQVPTSSAYLTPSPLTGLSTTEWLINAQGVINVANTTAGAISMLVVVSGTNGPGELVDLTTQNAPVAVPFNDDISSPSVVPSTYQPYVFLVATSGSTGNLVATSSGQSFGSFTVVG
jgi:hypothetical protein